MRHTLFHGIRMTALAGAALIVAACGGDDAADEAANDSLDSNLMLEQPMNDASAMESAANALEPAPPADTGNQGTDSTDVLGNTSGGDTGGNTVESNVSGM